MSIRTLLPAILILCLAAPVVPAQEIQPSGSVLWSRQVGGQVWSPLTLEGGLLYFGCDSGKAVAFDIAEQAVKWDVATGGRVRSRVTVHGGRAYFASDDGVLYAVDAATGDAAWHFDLGGRGFQRLLPAATPPYEYDYLHSSPVIAGGRLFIGSADGHLYAVDPVTGQELWRFKTGGKVRSTPVVRGGTVWFGSWDGRLYAVKADTGDPLWNADLGGIVQGTPALADGKVIVGSRGARVHALEADTGEPRWKYTHPDGSWVESSPAVQDGLVYIGSSDALKLFVLDVATGEVKWTYKTGGWTWGAPLVADGTAYIGSIGASPYYVQGVTLAAGLHAVDIDGRQARWVVKPGKAEGFITGGVFATPVADGDTVYFAGLDGTLYAVQR